MLSDLASTLDRCASTEAGFVKGEPLTEAMMGRKRGTGTVHAFGGEWTTKKLDILGKYLEAYATALHDKPTRERPFRKAYIDAFAGTGYRTMSRTGPDLPDEGTDANLALPDLAESESQQLLDGSARIALQVEPQFDRYIFIEQRRKHVRELEKLKIEFPDLASQIIVTHGDANTEIQALCAKRGWEDRRAVLFLDPYGMQVEWETIEAVAKTKAIDLWLLFPLGIGVNRLVTRSGEIPDSWQRRLDILLGTPDWRDEFYAIDRTQLSIFGGEAERVIKASIETMGRYFNDRLKRIFPGVADKPAVLRNSVGNPLFLLCFAAANEKGAPIAVKIANHLLKGLS